MPPTTLSVEHDAGRPSSVRQPASPVKPTRYPWMSPVYLDHNRAFPPELNCAEIGWASI